MLDIIMIDFIIADDANFVFIENVEKWQRAFFEKILKNSCERIINISITWGKDFPWKSLRRDKVSRCSYAELCLPEIAALSQ